MNVAAIELTLTEVVFDGAVQDATGSVKHEADMRSIWFFT
jgi:hypothetical protein